MNKKYYILIAILIAYFLIIFLVFGLDNLKLELKEFSQKDNYDDDILIVMLKNN